MTVFDLSAEQARAYFMEPENYGSTELPQYFDFTGILSVAEENVTAALRLKKLLQSAKEYLRRISTLSGSFTSVRPVHFWKAYRPMSVRPSGRSIF